MRYDLRRWVVLVVLAAARAAIGEGKLPMGDAPKPVESPHFPSRPHAFVWRNWETADLDRLAEVLGTTEANVRALGESMGLPPHQPVSSLQEQRGYISVIRRNWHLLPYEQLLTLLGWDEDQLAYTLKEDDFLWVKLGRHKPVCSPLRYETPTADQVTRCAEIKAIVQEHFGDLLQQPAEPRFSFIEALSAPVEEAGTISTDDGSIRFIYSYFAVYGDPLLDPDLDPYPDGLLQRLSNLGVNGVWLHTVLRQLAPSKDFPEFGDEHEVRLANLQRLVDRAAKYGIKVYLYMNEPRSMPTSFFANHEDIAGAHEDESTAMCTSVAKVHRFVEESLAYLFKEVDGLGGVFTITMSENLTHCCSRGGQKQCDRCVHRSGAEIVAEINRTITRGVRRGNPSAKVIVWDWGWPDDWSEEIIRGLPDDVYLMSVSEWSLPIERGGVATTVGEYSISSVGPGPRAQRHWGWAQHRGLKTMAKVQVNNTWELSAVPYLPTMNLVAEHMSNLAKAGINGQMLSWSLGGYPSPNLQIAYAFSREPGLTLEAALRRVAEVRYGSAAVPQVLAAWASFSKGFAEFPFHVACLYGGPQQVGPANLLYSTPTGHGATMVGFPFDDLTTWRAIYPPDVYVNQMGTVADGFAAGLQHMAKAVDLVAPGVCQEAIETDKRFSEAAYLHFASITNQARFIIARDAQPADTQTMKSVAEKEIEIAKRLFSLTRRDARIGYEASNHYYYYPTDLIEKVVNCHFLISGD